MRQKRTTLQASEEVVVKAVKNKVNLR
jgi:hypothetical protein